MSDDLLPPGRTDLERWLAETPELGRLAPEMLHWLWDAQNCPPALLPWLAWALSVDEWDSTASLAQQRAAIAASIGIHKIKGSVASVRQALAVLGHAGQLIEWWQQNPRGLPHTFLADVEIDHRGLDRAVQVAIERQIDAVKPARSHYALRMIGSSHCAVHFGQATVSGEDITVYPHVASEATAPAPGLRLGIGIHHWGTTTIYPREARL